MTSQIKQQMITIYILPDISRSKANQAMKLCQLIKYSMRYIFIQNSCRKWARETSSPPLFLFFKKALYKVKASGQHLSFKIFW